jgi:hypothetical protein
MRTRQSKYDSEYHRAKQALLEIGFIAEGCLVKRFITCGNASCRCHSSPDNRHGPYYQLTWKRDGKTVSQFISVELALYYEEWISNRRKLGKVITDLHRISKKAINEIITQHVSPSDKRIVAKVNKKLRKK